MTTSPVLRFDQARDLVQGYLRTEPAPEPPLRDLLDSLLGGIRELDRERAARERRLERTQLESETDPMTGLLNLQGWQSRLTSEQDRCRRFGEPAVVVTIDVGPAADPGRAAQSLRAALRPGAVLARTGPGRFATLLLGPDDAAITGQVQALRAGLVGASVTWSPLGL